MATTVRIARPWPGAAGKVSRGFGCRLTGRNRDQWQGLFAVRFGLGEENHGHCEDQFASDLAVIDPEPLAPLRNGNECVRGPVCTLVDLEPVKQVVDGSIRLSAPHCRVP